MISSSTLLSVSVFTTHKAIDLYSVEKIAEKPTNMDPRDPTRIKTFLAKEDPNAIKHD